MSTYLARLKFLEGDKNFQDDRRTEVSKGSKAPFETFETTRQAKIEKKYSASVDVITNSAATDLGGSGNDTFEFPAFDGVSGDGDLFWQRSTIVMANNRLQESSTQREDRWQAFQRNANRVLGAPVHECEGLLRQYQAEAGRRYGLPAARDMTQSLRGWVLARQIH